MNKNTNILIYVLLTIGAIIMFILFGLGWETTGLVWPFPWLIIAYWLTDSKKGNIFLLSFIIGCLFIAFLNLIKVLTLPYSSISLLNYLIVLIVFGLGMLLYNSKINTSNELLKYTREHFENSLDPLFIINPDGEIIDANIASTKISKTPKDKLIQKNIANIFVETDKVKFLLRNTLRGPVHNFPLTVNSRTDDTTTKVLVNASYEEDHQANKKKLFLVLRDISEQVETDLKKSELLEELKNANKELDTFSHSIAHDLKSPLRSINGFTNLLYNDYSKALDDEGRRLLKSVMDESKRMGKLIDDLMIFSNLSKKEIKIRNVDMNLLLKDVMSSLSESELNNKKIIIGKLPPVNGDEAFLSIVFSNLISNALKYSGLKENPIIEIGAKKEENEIVYFVKDNGVGFDMRYYDKLFSVFQRLHNQDEFEGTGIGLAIVSKIINRLNGKVWAEGKINEGATFYVSFVQH